jgi:protocatechuate 3,4-dioxygenase beta subunit
MAIPRWNYFLQLLLLYFSYYIKHSACQQQQVGPSNPHVLFYGNLRDDVGEPVKDAQVQFWHTDFNGNYYHPSDDLDGYELCSDTFSYFGTAETDAVGDFIFKTFRPGLYAGRPITHIHFKVWHNGQELLTSQFYFDDENASLMFDDMLVLTLKESIQDDNGNSFFYATKTVVVKNNMNIDGFEKLTPSQQEGPFYPLVDFFNVGNDMTAGLFDQLDGDGGGGVLTADEMPEMPTLESILPLSSAPSAGSRIFNVLILVLAFVHYFDADFL